MHDNHKYICQNCGHELETRTALYRPSEVDCGACSKGFFIPWTEAERHTHDMADQLAMELMARGIDPATIKVTGFSVGGMTGRTVIAESWQGVTQSHA